ncbi:hypothetical protein QYE76_044756 [Lolium multiflorum]|uniref:Uncharacterized protein n=1 Tax=Lolium multiflorum TaxID=4521 RepID=A0AAD8TL80_LOLMU|nr:hypothetical protein QYE76_044756 [Lolium multiflorum]
MSANGFSMVQQGVEVGVEEPPVAEGALGFFGASYCTGSYGSQWTGAWTGGGRCAGCYVGSSDRGLTGGGRCAGCYVGSATGGLDGGGRCAGCYVGSSDRGWTGRPDAPAATLEAATGPDGRPDAPTMGISFFSIAGGFLRGFSSVVEKMMGQERRLQ